VATPKFFQLVWLFGWCFNQSLFRHEFYLFKLGKEDITKKALEICNLVLPVPYYYENS